MPRNVARFEILMYLAITLTVLIGIVDFNRFAPTLGPALIVGTVVLVSAVIVWLAARRRQNWARWLLLIVFVIATPGYVMAFIELASGSIVTAVMSVMRTILNVAALYYVFTGDAHGWFRRDATA